MAKTKTGPNKSDRIREAFKAMPNAMAKEVVAHLKEKGIEVTDSLVYAVKKASKKKKPGRKPGTAPKAMVAQATVAPAKAAATPSSNGVVSVGASISLVRATAERVGGWASLKEIVEALQ